jgi:hypothetical protein
MSALYDWIIVGAGLAIGRLLVAIAVITVVTAILAAFFIWEERSK